MINCFVKQYLYNKKQYVFLFHVGSHPLEKKKNQAGLNLSVPWVSPALPCKRWDSKCARPCLAEKALHWAYFRGHSDSQMNSLKHGDCKNYQTGVQVPYNRLYLPSHRNLKKRDKFKLSKQTRQALGVNPDHWAGHSPLELRSQVLS